MKKNGESSRVGIGRGDGVRYVGVTKSLSREEVASIAKSCGLPYLQPESLFHTTHPDASVIALSSSDERAIEVATDIAVHLRTVRPHQVELILPTEIENIVWLSGPNSSPFNPQGTGE